MPTLESLNQHPLPQWYADAKLGIFVHWGSLLGSGLGSTGPSRARLPQHPTTFKNNPYAEWYLNVMRIDGSPTQAYHREHYGADYDYYNFAPIFDQEIKKWNPDAWAKTFHDAGGEICGSDH